MTAVEQQTALAVRVLQNCRNELYSLFPYLDGAFAALTLHPGGSGFLSLKGQTLYFSPGAVLRRYAADPAAMRRGYLHILLHGLFLHPFELQPPRHWDLACDLAVEQLIAREGQPRLAVPGDLRDRCLALLGPEPRSARELAGLLTDGFFPYEPAELARALAFDDHSLWRPDPDSRARWGRVLAFTNQSRRAGSRAGQSREQMDPADSGRYDYRRYLQRFAVPREERSCDHESFDYIYYTLGLERYGDLPLIEPLEYREGHKLEELVIAIDTSGSCSRETVQGFLAETYGILSQRENFFERMTVYLIQCDCLIQDVALIRSAEQWHNYSRAITIQGRGGTDFTPVFRYVEQLRRDRKLKNLRALLYFTDGDGVYPRTPTDYETAFVFLEKTEKMELAPKWAARLLVR